MNRKVGSILIALALAVVMVLPAGCKPAGKAPQTTLRLALSSDPVTLDPAQVAELVSGYVVSQMYEGLTAKKADGTVGPSLADSWDVNNGGKEYTFHLKKNVKFQSGNPFTAKDVKASWERALLPETKSGMASYYLGSVVGATDIVDGKSKELSGVQIIDPSTVKVELTSPSVEFPSMLCVECTFITDSKALSEAGSGWTEKVSLGTGPFKFVSWTHNSQVVLGANSDYHGEGPYIGKLQYSIVPQPDTQVSMYEGGELDVIEVPDNQHQRIQGDATLSKELVSVSRAQIRYIGMNPNLYGPFKDPRVRQAFSMAIDKENLASTLLSGAVKVAYGIIPPSFPGFNDKLKKLAYDPAKAQALLTEAGYPGGKGLPPLTLSILASDSETMQYVVSQLKTNLGVDVKLAQLERAKLLGDMNKKNVAFFFFGWTADYTSPRSFLYDLLYSASPMDRSQYQNNDFDAMIQKTESTVDTAARLALYQQAEQIAVDDAAFIWMWFPQFTYLVRPGVTGLGFTSLGPLPYNLVKIAQ